MQIGHERASVEHLHMKSSGGLNAGSPKRDNREYSSLVSRPRKDSETALVKKIIKVNSKTIWDI